MANLSGRVDAAPKDKPNRSLDRKTDTTSKDKPSQLVDEEAAELAEPDIKSRDDDESFLD